MVNGGSYDAEGHVFLVQLGGFITLDEDKTGKFYLIVVSRKYLHFKNEHSTNRSNIHTYMFSFTNN